MNRNVHFTTAAAIILLTFVSIGIAENTKQFLGRWALTIPGGGAGWLGIEQENGYLDGSILWGGGSVVPVTNVYTDGDKINIVRQHKIDRKDRDGNVVRTQFISETISATVAGDEMKLVQMRPNNNGKGVTRKEFTGKRIPAMPAKPDLSKVKYGEPVKLFDGSTLDGWKLTNPRQKSGWSAKDGILINMPAQPKTGHISYGNLRTVEEFGDFNLSLELKVPRRGNSGIYLRGIYEVQVSDTYGRGLDSHNMGAIYSRITPTQSAEKMAGQWQTMDITLVDRHVTVILNGKTIVDNQPLLGCTGGALFSDESRRGPIYLQGDHTGVNYRNIVLKPIK